MFDVMQLRHCVLIIFWFHKKYQDVSFHFLHSTRTMVECFKSAKT